jgi:hypothetical protein
VERPAGAPAPAEAAVEPTANADEVRVAARLDFLSERLARAVEPETDFTIALARLPRAWSKRTRRGIDVSAEVVNLRGAIDVRDLTVQLGGDGLELDAAVRAVFSGQIEASLLRIRHAVPLRVESALRQTVPLRIISADGGLALSAELQELEIPLEVEARLRSLPVRFSTRLAVPGEILSRAVRLPALVLTELKFPTRVERGEVVASKRLPIEIAWSVVPAASPTAAIEARGALRLR